MVETLTGTALALVWLERRGVQYQVQEPVLSTERDSDIVISGELGQPVLLRVFSDESKSDVDMKERMVLIGLGYEVVDIEESRLAMQPDYTMNKALRGEEV